MKPVISIILPVYNGEKYLEKAIGSIVAQDFTDFELIVVNDCSTDRTLKIIENFVLRDPRVRLINNAKNLKLPASLNAGHKNALGDLMTWTSDDNLPHKNWLSSLYAEIKKTNADIVFSNHTHIDENGDFLYESYTGPVENLPISSCIGASFLYKRKVFEELGGYDTNLFLIEDYDFWARAYRKGFVWRHLPVSLYDYRSHDDSLSSSSSNKIPALLVGYKLEHLHEYKMTKDIKYLAYMDIVRTGKGMVPKKIIFRLLTASFFLKPFKFLDFYAREFAKSILRKNILPTPIYNLMKKTYLYSRYVKKYFKFKKLSGENSRFKVYWKNRNVQLYDETEKTGFDRHYTYHPAWAARVVKKINPKVHFDISSILQFSTILSAFVPVEFYDFRPADIKLDGLESKKADLLSLPFADNSIDSLSCMHTIEHVGLGRYGDPLDPDADIKAMKELKRVLSIGGSLLIVVPIGKNKIQYNAHRIYSYEELLKNFSELELKEFSLIREKEGGIIVNAKKEQANEEDYGCGCFWFIKK